MTDPFPTTDWKAARASHSWLHRDFPPQPSVCILCGAEAGTPEAIEPCRLLAGSKGQPDD